MTDMAAQRGFFSWWFGELREVFSGRPVPVHALALSAREIALIEKGVDTPLGVVDIDATDWLEQIEGLRSRILRRGGRSPQIEIQLPSEQVMFSKLAIDPAADRLTAVKAQLREMTGQNPDDLIFDIASKPDVEGRTVVAVAPASTVREAAGYASQWGFDPVRVTSIESPRAFRRGPDFEYEGARADGSVLPKITVALAVLAVCLSAGAAGHALSIRSDLADRAVAEAERLPEPNNDVQERELALAQFAHGAATAIEMRDTTLPVWRLLAEVASVIPSDVVLTGVKYETGQLRLSGSAASIEALSEAMDQSAIFSGPYFPETRAKRAGRARFVMEVAVDERSVR